MQETRGWDESKQQTFSQRLKEGSADYRYFPEPDFPKMVLSKDSAFDRGAIRKALPELPWSRRERYSKLGLKESDAVYLSGTYERGIFFDAVLALIHNDASLAGLAANYVVSDLGGYYAKSDDVEYKNISPETFVALMRMVYTNELSSRGAKDILMVMAESGGDPQIIAKEKNLLQVSDPEALRAHVREVISANETIVAEYKAGKQAGLQFLLGQAMKATKGSGNPQVLKDLLIEELGT